MRSRIKLLGTLLLLTVATLVGGSSNPIPTIAAEFKCKSAPTCPNEAQCSGTYFEPTGCNYKCYTDGTRPGEIVFSGSANCSATSSGNNGGSGSGYAGLQGYCAENWMWDAGCSGPDDPYTPPGY